MNEATGVELNLEVNGSCVDVRPHGPATLLVLRVALHIHDAIESRVTNIDVDLNTISKAVDHHLWPRKVSSPNLVFCRDNRIELVLWSDKRLWYGQV